MVDTVGFIEKSWYDFAGTPHTKQMHLTEKFHRRDFGDMEMEVTIDDPGALTKPWVINRTTTLETDFEMTEYVCNENNQDPGHLDATLGADGKPTTATKPRGVPPVRSQEGSGAPVGTDSAPAGRQGGFIRRLGSHQHEPAGRSFVSAWAKKIYDERKADKGENDPERVCLPDGAVRLNPLPYKIVQGPKMIALLWEGNTHSYRRFFLDGRKPNLDVEPESYTGLSIGKWDGDALVVDTVGFQRQDLAGFDRQAA